jgi:hypothetical protein
MILYASTFFLNMANQARLAEEEDFGQACVHLRTDSLLHDFQASYDKGDDKLCSSDCYCAASKPHILQ